MKDNFSAAPSRPAMILAGVLMLLMTAAAALLLPYANQPTAGSNLRPVLITALAVNNSIIAYLILLHFYVKRRPATGLLGTAFAYSALMAIYQLLMLPEVLPGQLGLQLGSHLSIWLWFARLAGFAMLIMLAMLCLAWQPKPPLSPHRSSGFLLGCLLLAVSLIWLVTQWLPPYLPDLGRLVSQQGDYRALRDSGLVIALLLCWGGALLSVLLVTRLRSAFHCWLALCCYGYLLYLVLLFSSSQRLTVGWYASRFFEQFAATIMLGALLFEVFRLQKRLQSSYSQAYETSIRDSLTGLFSRRHFDNALDAIRQRPPEQARPFTVLMADIDHFKRYNDSFGHVQGDDCLRQIAACMAQQLRDGDTLARYGGEEFIAILDGCDELHAAQIAERIRCAVEQLAIPAASDTAAQPAVVTVSIGLHCQPATALMEAEHQLVELADKALYLAKHQGRNRVCRLSGAALPAG